MFLIGWIANSLAIAPGKLIKRVDRIRCRTREEARADIFKYIEVFYNRKRRYGYPGNIRPDESEQRTTGLYETVH